MSAVKLIKQMLNLDPQQRPTFEQILKTEFIQEDQAYFVQWIEICKAEIANAEKEAEVADEEEGRVE